MTYGKNNLWRRILCLAVILALVMSFAACGQSSADTTIPSAAPTQGTTQPTTQFTEPPTKPTLPAATTSPTQPTEPTQPTDPTEPPAPAPNELFYTLTQEDVDEFYSRLATCEALALAGEDMDAIDAATVALDESYELISAQMTISMILHYSHTLDKDLEQQYLDCVKIATEANDAYIQMARRVYLSDTPAKDALFEGWTDADIESLLAYDEQIVLIQQRNAEIEVEYRNAKDDATKITLYIEFVQNNNRIAQFYDYDNYYTYAYERVYSRDYSSDTLLQMRQFAKTYLTGCYNGALTNFQNSFYGNLGYWDQVAVQDFLVSEYDALGGKYVQRYLDALPEEMGSVMKTMLEKDSLFTDASDAEPGAFTTSIGDRSYCYFGPGYASANTVIHEGGHYYASRYADLMGIPLDLAETHSQANEWLFIGFLDGKMPAKQYTALVDYLLYEDIAMVMTCLMVDEFEQRVYTTDLTGFTAADFDAIMDEVTLQYFPNGDAEIVFGDMNHYWRLVVVDQPVYYVSYAVSSVASMSLYSIAQADFAQATEIYRKLCQEPVEDAGFLGNIQAAGLSSPFDEEFYRQLQQLINDRG